MICSPMESFLRTNYQYLAKMQHQLRNQIALLHLLEKSDRPTRNYVKQNILYLMRGIESTQVMISWAHDFPADVDAFVREV